jgi:hypothetical protein
MYPTDTTHNSIIKGKNPHQKAFLTICKVVLKMTCTKTKNATHIDEH